MDTDAVLRLLQEVAEAVINPRFRALATGQVIEKNPGDLVTVADREAEVLITQALLESNPGAVVLGEEAFEADRGILDRYAAAEHGFTVDPIDGTRNFVHGSPDHAVMVAERRGRQVVRSWIWQPQHATAYVAELGSGAFRNGERLVRAPVPPGSAPRGVTSYRPWRGTRLGELPTLELTWVCCGVDYPKLVEGAADYILYRGRKPWDHAPGSLLLSEAGAVLGTFTGEPYDARGIPDSPLLAAADRATYDLVLPLVPSPRSG
ncbi:MAG TPA: inositol monophosphatase [Intrasporangium sp.]|uniref:inositol monophosphatase family protein n=1 Tax=Intrasporangium sp. TaxID=1925024 RepID=UPI002D76D791|nr:inositol monophosphatase [Intrasporangium sp.]HET7398473.1 inositol monophosphatase [Intrasporangium sp.]